MARARKARFPADLADAAQKAHEALVEMVAEGNDALHGGVLREGHAARRAHPRRPAHRPSANGASSRCCAPPACTTSARDLILELHRRELPGPDRARRRHRQRRTARRSSAPITDTEPVSAFVFKTVADPFAGRVTYFKVISGVVKNDANLVERRSAARPSAWRTSACLLGKTIAARHRTARRRYRRGRQAEGHADRRHAGRQRRR